MSKVARHCKVLGRDKLLRLSPAKQSECPITANSTGYGTSQYGRLYLLRVPMLESRAKPSFNINKLDGAKTNSSVLVTRECDVRSDRTLEPRGFLCRKKRLCVVGRSINGSAGESRSGSAVSVNSSKPKGRARIDGRLGNRNPNPSALLRNTSPQW